LNAKLISIAAIGGYGPPVRAKQPAAGLSAIGRQAIRLSVHLQALVS